MLPTKIVVKIGCAVLRPERTGRLAIEAVRSIASAAGDTDACLIFFHSRCMVLFELVFDYKVDFSFHLTLDHGQTAQKPISKERLRSDVFGALGMSFQKALQQLQEVSTSGPLVMLVVEPTTGS